MPKPRAVSRGTYERQRICDRQDDSLLPDKMQKEPVSYETGSFCMCGRVINFCYTSVMSNTAEIHFEGKIAQKAIIIKDGKVLLMRDPRAGRVIWEIPGGRMNINEVPQEALKREIFEELGVEIAVGDIVYMEQFLQGNEGKRAFMIAYKAELVDVTIEFNLDPAEVCEIAWVTREELPQYPLFPEFTRALDCYFEKYVN